jgi:uncharacterized protein (TIGR00251 family)
MNIRDVSRATEEGVEVNMIVSPNSGRQGMSGIDEWRKRLVIRICSPPVDGKANREVEEYLKKITGRRSEIIKGHTDRQKTVMIYGDADEIISSLEASM